LPCGLRYPMRGRLAPVCSRFRRRRGLAIQCCRMAADIRAARAETTRGVVHQRRPVHIEITVRRHRGRGKAVDPKRSIRDRNNVHKLRIATGLSSYSLRRSISPPNAVQGGETCGPIPKNVHCAIRANYRSRTLPVEHVAHDQFRIAKSLAPVARMSNSDGGLDVSAIARLKMNRVQVTYT